MITSQSVNNAVFMYAHQHEHQYAWCERAYSLILPEVERGRLVLAQMGQEMEIHQMKQVNEPMLQPGMRTPWVSTLISSLFK